MDFGDIDFDSVLNFSSSDFIPAARRQNLEDLQDDIMNSVNFTAYKDYLNENPLAFDLQEVFDNLTALATHFSAIMVHACTYILKALLPSVHYEPRWMSWQTTLQTSGTTW